MHPSQDISVRWISANSYIVTWVYNFGATTNLKLINRATSPEFLKYGLLLGLLERKLKSKLAHFLKPSNHSFFYLLFAGRFDLIIIVVVELHN